MKLTQELFFKATMLAMVFAMLSLLVSCDEDSPMVEDPNDVEVPPPVLKNGAVFLLIDEESIDNGNEPNGFSDTDVNDKIAKVGLRATLPYFAKNVGKNIVLYTGDVGDEGWFAPKTIPTSWKSAGPSANGTLNFLKPGPGLGLNETEDLLDKIPDVTPLRAKGLSMLKGVTVLAVVYDSDVSINYDPLNGSLKGANLGVVALTVLKVEKRTDGSSNSLPKVTVRIESVDKVSKLPLSLFENAPVPESSSNPVDINPTNDYPAPNFVVAP